MNRRGFLGAGAKVVVGAAVVSQMSAKSAFAAEGEKVLIESDISFNHGHTLSLDVADVVQMLRRAEAESGEAQIVSIQGQSGHPHDIALTQTDLMTLFLGGELTLESTLVAGHTHNVVVNMKVQSAV